MPPPGASGCETDAVITVSDEQFEVLVGQALDSIPEALSARMQNVALFVEDSSPDGLLGLYEGIPLTERGDWYAGVLPDRITIYRDDILRICETYADVVREVRVTVVHEIAHHFGIDDDRLHELGW
jgi:predicted Zn-dependent protease with MMP-like domain